MQASYVFIYRMFCPIVNMSCVYLKQQQCFPYNETSLHVLFENLKSTILLLVVILRLLRLEFIHLELIMSARVLIVPIFYLML